MHLIESISDFNLQEDIHQDYNWGRLVIQTSALPLGYSTGGILPVENKYMVSQ